jgi:hypothetical protein
MTPGFLFALFACLCGFAFVLDMLLTRYGIAVYGAVETNPLYKILPATLQNFFFKTAFGSFLDGGIKLIGTGFAAKLLYDHGYGHENGSYADCLFFAIPLVGSLVIDVRNLFVLRKMTKLTDVVPMIPPVKK